MLVCIFSCTNLFGGINFAEPPRYTSTRVTLYSESGDDEYISGWISTHDSTYQATYQPREYFENYISHTPPVIFTNQTNTSLWMIPLRRYAAQQYGIYMNTITTITFARTHYI